MNPNRAIKKALSSNRAHSTIHDLGDMDFSILSQNNPFDAAPAIRSGFSEASSGWSKYQAPPLREVETVVTQPPTTMVNPAAIAAASEEAQKSELMAQIGSMLRRKLAEAPAGSINRTLGDPNTYANVAPDRGALDGLEITSPHMAQVGQRLVPSSAPSEGEMPDLYDFTQRTLRKDGVPPSAPSTGTTISNAQLLDSIAAGDEESIRYGRELYKTDPEFKQAADARFRKPQEQAPEEATPFYRQPAVMYGGLGLGAVGAGALAYNAFSSPSEEPVYNAPGHGQMPRSFR